LLPIVLTAKNCTSDPLLAANNDKGMFNWDPTTRNKSYSLTINYWCISFFVKSNHPIPWRDLITLPIDPISSVAGGDDTTMYVGRTRRQAWCITFQHLCKCLPQHCQRPFFFQCRFYDLQVWRFFQLFSENIFLLLPKTLYFAMSWISIGKKEPYLSSKCKYFSSPQNYQAFSQIIFKIIINDWKILFTYKGVPSLAGDFLPPA
jgi:hypothetical protein